MIQESSSPTPLQPMIWIDMEMSGLDPEENRILEIAVVITDHNLKVLAEGPDLIIHHGESFLAAMDDWNKEHHKKSGLWQEVITSRLTEREAEAEILAFVKKHSQPKQSPLCGNSVWQDKRFLQRYMKDFHDHLHYRIIDVSTVKELVKRWYPETNYKKEKEIHRARTDIHQSIEELLYYKVNFFK